MHETSGIELSGAYEVHFNCQVKFVLAMLKNVSKHMSPDQRSQSKLVAPLAGIAHMHLHAIAIRTRSTQENRPSTFH